MQTSKQTTGETLLGRELQPLSDLRPSPVTAGDVYLRSHAMVWQRAIAFMASMVSEGRLCGLKPSEWSMLLVGVALCGIATLLF